MNSSNSRNIIKPKLKDSPYLKYIVIIGIALLFIFYFYKETQFEDFDNIENINGIVLGSFEYKGSSYMRYVDQDGDKEVRKIKVPVSKNNATKSVYLCDNIRRGDHIMKEGTEYFVVCRKGTGYRYKVGDFNYSERPFYCPEKHK